MAVFVAGANTLQSSKDYRLDQCVRKACSVGEWTSCSTAESCGPLRCQAGKHSQPHGTKPQASFFEYHEGSPGIVNDDGWRHGCCLEGKTRTLASNVWRCPGLASCLLPSHKIFVACFPLLVPVHWTVSFTSFFLCRNRCLLWFGLQSCIPDGVSTGYFHDWRRRLDWVHEACVDPRRLRPRSGRCYLQSCIDLSKGAFWVASCVSVLCVKRLPNVCIVTAAELEGERGESSGMLFMLNSTPRLEES